MKLHVISFQVPFPPKYGGLIDVFYKLKALKEAGCSVILHTYQYHTEQQPALLEVADSVYYYERYNGWGSMLSFLPYIVYSRRNSLLLERLCEDDAPILFEGLHTCYFLSDKRLAHREKWVRMHNIEHDYYENLSYSATSLKKKCYYRLEAMKLRRFERKLQYATKILAITPTDAAYFSHRYPAAETLFLPCFFDHSVRKIGTETDPYILYHGNLSVDENIRVACFIIEKLVPMLGEHIPIIIAGNEPDKLLVEKAACYSQIRLIANPEQAEMDQLISSARINLMLTFQKTGIKLKLIYALLKGRGHCLINSPMLSDERLGEWCVLADTLEEMVAAIGQLYKKAPSSEALRSRTEALKEGGYTNQVTLLLR